MDEQWGPWIEHDGKGCPVKGQYVTTESYDGAVLEHIAHGVLEGPDGPDPVVVDGWYWKDCETWGELGWRIIRYRIRKPKGLTILEGLLEDLDVKMDEHQGA